MKMEKFFFLFILVVNLIFSSCSNIDDIKNKSKIISTKKIIGEEGMSYAFTDFVFFENQFFLTFRKSDRHDKGDNGKIQIYSSLDGENWNFIKEFSIEGIDLRDPKFSLNEDKLYLYIHGSKYEGANLIAFSDYNSVYSKLNGWQELQDVFLDNLQLGIANIDGNEAWPWRVTWYKGKAYTIGYGVSGIFDLYFSEDGNLFKNLNAFDPLMGQPNEATIRVNSEGEFFVIARRLYNTTLVGRSFNPSANWDWSNEIKIENFGGPNFVFTENNKMIVSGRYNGWVSLTHYDLKSNTIIVIAEIESGGDCGYPGMFIKEDFLWMSYYSSHENIVGSSIYVSKINLKELGD